MEVTTMPGPHRRDLWLVAGLMVSGAGLATASAQEGPSAVAPLPAPSTPGPVADGEPAPAPMVAPAGPESVPLAATPPGRCTCGDRRGLSRWRWHRTQCKRHLQE